MRTSSKLATLLGVVAILCRGEAQETTILSFERNGTLTWTNETTNVYCGLEYTFRLPAVWSSAEPPLWNIVVTSRVMSVTVPLDSIQADSMFFRLVSSVDPLPGWETYDVESSGIPRFAASNYIELAKIEQISCFRSGEGHDYSDQFESCRNMKHYFLPTNSVDWSAIQIRSPVSGSVYQLGEEGWVGGGTQVRIRSTEFPAFYFILFHVQTNGQLAVGDSVRAGQLLGTHIGNQTTSDIAVGVNTPGGWKLVSFFDVMTDSLFDDYQARGLGSRTDAIISKEARDANPLACGPDGDFADPGTIPGWITLH